MTNSSGAAALLWLTVAAAANAQLAVTEGERLHPDVSPERDEIVIDLLGDLWTVPRSGGVARRLAESDLPASRPRWSPDGRRVVFQAGPDSAARLRLFDESDQSVGDIEGAPPGSRSPDWHPSGERIVFTAPDERGALDLHELDLASGLYWRVTTSDEDDIDPAWSADGRDLAWIRQSDAGFSLLLKPFGQAARVLVESDDPLAAPSFRPDGTLLTYFVERDGDFELRMIILSDPPLDRALGQEGGLYPSPVSWDGRGRLYYSNGRQVRVRDFDDWSGQPVTFRASPSSENPAPNFVVADRRGEPQSPGENALVLRAARIYDGYSRSYREAVDVRVENGRIVDVSERRDWGTDTVIDLPGTTLLPGFIDAYAGLPDRSARTGAALLAWGVTTVVANPPSAANPADWEGEAEPGPRLLSAATLATAPSAGEPRPFLVIADPRGARGQEAKDAVAAWQAAGVPVLATDWAAANRVASYLLPGADAGAGSTRPARGAGSARSGRLRFNLSQRQLVSGLADRRTPGLENLRSLRQAPPGDRLPGGSRVPMLDDLRRSRLPVVVGSAQNGFPPGLALHAELLALQAAGLSPADALQSAGRHAARLLGLSGEAGEIAAGARADLVFVTGDPLQDVGDAANVIGVVRNGRFQSLGTLLERAAESVE